MFTELIHLIEGARGQDVDSLIDALRSVFAECDQRLTHRGQVDISFEDLTLPQIPTSADEAPAALHVSNFPGWIDGNDIIINGPAIWIDGPAIFKKGDDHGDDDKHVIIEGAADVGGDLDIEGDLDITGDTTGTDAVFDTIQVDQWNLQDENGDDYVDEWIKDSDNIPGRNDTNNCQVLVHCRNGDLTWVDASTFVMIDEDPGYEDPDYEDLIGEHYINIGQNPDGSGLYSHPWPVNRFGIGAGHVYDNGSTFDGTQYFTVDSWNDVQDYNADWTINFWVKFDRVDENQTIFTTANASSGARAPFAITLQSTVTDYEDPPGVFTDYGQFVMNITGLDDTTKSASATAGWPPSASDGYIVQDVWYFVTVRFDRSAGSITMDYVDENDLYSESDTNSFAAAQDLKTPTGQFQVAYGYNHFALGDTPFYGTLDMVRIYQSYISDENRDLLFNSGVGRYGAYKRLMCGGYLIPPDSTYVRVDGTNALTADWDAGEYEIKAKSFDLYDSSDSGVTNAIRFGDSQEAIVYRDGTDLVIDPQQSGDGVVSVPTGGVTLTKGLKLVFNG